MYLTCLKIIYIHKYTVHREFKAKTKHTHKFRNYVLVTICFFIVKIFAIPMTIITGISLVLLFFCYHKISSNKQGNSHFDSDSNYKIYFILHTLFTL